MQQQGRIDLSKAAATMAANQVRVIRYADLLSSSMDELIAATAREDWSEVQRVSGELAEQSRSNGYRGVSAMAQRVCDEAHRPENSLGIKRSLVRLIGTCGRVGDR